MKTVLKAMLAGLLMTTTAFTTTVVYAADCKSLQDDKNLIYASQGYCFNDPEAKQKFGEECRTKRPKFSAAETKVLAEIEKKQKELNCPKKD